MSAEPTETPNGFKPGDMPEPLMAESAFATLFPKYREKYLREVTAKLKEFGILCELNLFEGSMTVKTTRKTWDPYAIIKARDLIKLLSRSVPVQQAVRVMEDDMACGIVKIGNILRNQERFVKRRQRLIGPNGDTLKAIELLTNCYVMVQGNTVAIIGPHRGVEEVQTIVTDCIKNIHPIYHIKTMMIRRELAKNPDLAKENWDRFLPKFTKKNVKKKKVVQKTKKTRAVLPPLPAERKDQGEMESGAFFLNKNEAELKKQAAEKEAKQQKRARLAEKKREKEAMYIAPQEEAPKKKKEQDSMDIASLKQKVKAGQSKKRVADTNDDYIVKKKRKTNAMEE